MPIDFEIRNRNVTPPQGWKYTQPESGGVFKSYDYRSWIKDIASHRKANGYAMGDEWEEQLISDACQQNPHWSPLPCRRLSDDKLRVKRRAGFKDAMNFLKVLEGFIKGGGLYVSEDIANARAEKCAACKFNRPLSFGCGACEAGIRRLLGWLLGKRTVFAQDSLESCEICACSLKAAVWFPLRAQLGGLSEEQKASLEAVENCWKKESKVDSEGL